jgi:hypothetical protein
LLTERFYVIDALIYREFPAAASRSTDFCDVLEWTFAMRLFDTRDSKASRH